LSTKIWAAEAEATRPRPESMRVVNCMVVVVVVFGLVLLVGGLIFVGDLIVWKIGCCCEDEMLCDDEKRLERR
jgi:uncharacterized Tic20 family protein